MIYWGSNRTDTCWVSKESEACAPIPFKCLQFIKNMTVKGNSKNFVGSKKITIWADVKKYLFSPFDSTMIYNFSTSDFQAGL